MLVFLLQGGGLGVASDGAANLDGCQVYENVASSTLGDFVSLVSLVHNRTHTCNVPMPRWNVTCAHVAGRGTLHLGHGNANQHQRIR